MIDNFSASLPQDLEAAVRQAAADWDSNNGTARLWKKDASLWTNSDESEWLGWLDIVDEQLALLSRFKALAAEVREDGFSHVLHTTRRIWLPQPAYRDRRRRLPTRQRPGRLPTRESVCRL